MPLSVVNRRELMQTIAVGTTCSVLAEATPARNADQSPVIIDTNISLFQWPFRRLPLDSTETLVGKLRSLGVSQAWAGSFEGLLHRDVAGVNERLAQACGRWSELVPIGCVNPMLPGWRSDLARCCKQQGMPGIRVYPNYHGYSLADAKFRQVLEEATESGRFVQIVVAVEDIRTQHPLARVADVDLNPLPGVVRSIPRSVVQLLNARPRPADVELLGAVEGIYFDTARIEGTDGVARLVDNLPTGRVLYGSHAPLLIPEAALIRVHESGELATEALQNVFAGSAKQMLERVRA